MNDHELSPEQVLKLANELNSPVLAAACALYYKGGFSWEESMQVGAIAAARMLIESQNEHLSLLRRMSAPTLTV